MKKFIPLLFLTVAAQQLCAQSLDLTFGATGYVKEVISTNDDTATSQVIQSDGKIVVAGFQNNGSNEDIVVIRYNVDGTLDNTFSSDGKVEIALTSSSNERANCIALQTDGKIVIAGYTDTSGTQDFLLCRLTASGVLDNTFDTDGIVTTDSIRFDADTNDEVATSLAIQSNGKIVVVGTGYSDQPGSFDEILVVRYNEDGSLDNNFSDDGIYVAGRNRDDEGNAVAIQSDGKIVIAGTSTDENTQLDQTAIIRLDADGTLDNDFDSDGRMYTSHAENNSALGVIVTDTNIAIVGEYDGDYAIQRFDSDGSIDNTFDGDGLATVEASNPTSFTMQDDGKYLVAGSTAGINNQIIIARFNRDGSLDEDFGTDGVLTFNSIGYYQAVSTIGLDEDNNIVVSGYAESIVSLTGTDFLTIRFTNTVVTSVLDEELMNVSFHPNPTNNAIFLDLGKTGNEIQIEVINSVGTVKSAYTFKQAQNIQLDIDGPQGIYFLNITKDGQNKMVKVIKQ